MSSTGASITVTFEQFKNSRCASREPQPGDASIPITGFVLCDCPHDFCLIRASTLFVALPHSPCTAQAIQQQACGSHSAGIRIVISDHFFDSTFAIQKPTRHEILFKIILYIINSQLLFVRTLLRPTERIASACTQNQIGLPNSGRELWRLNCDVPLYPRKRTH